MSRRTWISATLGMPIVLTPYLVDGDVFTINDGSSELALPTLLLGTRRRTELEKARHHGKWLAQQGLIEWLAYIGEKPIPKHQRTHEDVLRALRAHT